MQRDQKPSSDNEYDIKFILMFTAAFVVISSILLASGYALLSVTGILGQGQAEGTGDPTATPTPSPTVRPTPAASGVPTTPPEPTPVITPAPTPTPSPTPIPSPYNVAVRISPYVSGMTYNVTFSMMPGYQSLDMTRTRLVINDWEKTYCDYDYDGMMYYFSGWWQNGNGDKMLDPGSESLTFEISTDFLEIPMSRETRLMLSFEGTTLVNVPLPALLVLADLPDELPDPGTGSGTGGSGTSGNPWINE